MKAKKQKPAEPSTRDKLSASFLKAFQNDFETYGGETIEKLREESPSKYAEIAAKLIAAIEPRGEGFDSCRTKEELGRAAAMQPSCRISILASRAGRPRRESDGFKRTAAVSEATC